MSSPANVAVVAGGRAGHSGRTILRNVDVAFPAGSVTRVTGANGSGKSTLLAILAGLHPLDDGSLQLARGARRAFVPQRSPASDMLPLTVADVVGMGRWSGWRRGDRRADRSFTSACISAVGLAGFERRSLAELSGGQRQRAFVAQGLAQRADLLLLDEPAAGLDEHGAMLLDRCIAAEQERGAAVVLVTHDRDGSLEAPRRAHIHNGIVELLPPWASPPAVSDAR